MRARFVALWAAAVIATAAAFVVHLALRFENVRLGYEVGAARKEQRALVQKKRLLALEAATLRETSRVERVAREELGMEIPDGARVIPVGARPRPRAAGRVQ